MIARLMAWGWQIAALALAAGLLVQTLRLAGAQRAAAQAASAYHQGAAAAERQARQQSEAYRQLEERHHAQIAQIGAETSAALDAADADAGRARAAQQRLQHDLAAYIEQHRRAAQARAAAGQCPPEPAALDLLAQLQRRADARAGELAAIADTARTRGSACERAYDAGNALNAAGQPPPSKP
jgi:hypothetical protein